MAGPYEAADDLITELEKLMAQDDRKVQPSAPATAQLVPVRIPGESVQEPAAGGPTDFLRSLAAVDARKPEASRQADAPDTAKSSSEHLPSEMLRVQESRPQEPSAQEQRPEQVNLDFDLRSGVRTTSGQERAQTPSQSVEEPAFEPVAADNAAGYDSIADLISAELAGDPAPSPHPVPGASAAPPQDLRAAADDGSTLMAATIAANGAAPHGEILGSSRADHDRFRIPPVFGLGSTGANAAAPAASAAVVQPESRPTPIAPVSDESVAMRQPATPAAVALTPVGKDNADIDPIDEIESLIGRAMRVEFDLPADEAPAAAPTPIPAAPRPAPSPALPSLATPTAPHSGAGALSAADQTIFAAAEATGANVGWVNTPHTTEAEPEFHHAAPRQSRRGISRVLAGPLAAVTLLLVAGFGLYWVLGLGGRDAGPAPLLAADSTPTKEVALAVAADDSTAPQSAVFNEIGGGATGADEQLISRDQADVNEVTQEAASPSDISEEGLANRKVRTVKVRPDGTIVSGDDSVAGSTILPVDRPNIPAVPSTETTIPELLANANTEAVEPAPAPVTAVPVQPGSTVPAVDLAGNLIAGKTAVVPLTRPAGLKLSAATPPAVEIPTAPAEAPSVAVLGAIEVPALGDTAPAYVQLASQRSEAEARQSAQNMVTRYGPLFGGANLEVQRVDLGVKGIYYRVRVPANSLEQANLICTNVKAAGGDCFTL